MISRVPLKIEHVIQLKEIGALTYLTNHVDTEKLKVLVNQPHSFAAVDGEEVLACLGVIEYWKGRGEAWAFFRQNIGARFVSIHRQVVSFLDSVDVRRIEACVEVDFERGHRWIKQLGFVMECPLMPFYQINGQSSSRYVRIKPVKGELSWPPPPQFY